MRDLSEPFCDCQAEDVRDDLLPVEETLRRCRSLAAPLAEVGTLPLRRAVGRVTAGPVAAASALPRFDAAAMDGYAVRVADFRGDGPWRVAVSGRAAAGGPLAERPAGAAVRILTGAPVPAGCDAVVMQEHVRREGDMIVLETSPERGRNIRRAAEDVGAGETLLPAGRLIGPREAAALAAAGVGEIVVRRRARVAVFRTGDELRPAGAPLGAAQIWDANGPMLAAALDRPWIETVDLGVVEDRPEAVARALSEAAAQADLVVSSGGASVGDEDHMVRALAAAGGEAHVLRVAMKPGKPFMLGRLGGAIYCGLPGTPMSAYVCWTLFGETLAAGLAGLAAPAGGARFVRADFAMERRPGRCEFRPVRLGEHDASGAQRAELVTSRFTHSLPALAAADGLAVIPADVERVAPGDLLRFLPAG